MWTRAMLKENGRYSMQRNYWYCMAALMGFFAIAGGAGNFAGLYYNFTMFPRMAMYGGSSYSGVPSESMMLAMFSGMLGSFIVMFFITFALRVVLVYPIQVGLNKFFIMNRTSVRTDVSYLVFAFKNGYGNILKTMFITRMFLLLWYCLCIVPGIIKSYSYMLVPYILADNPNMDTMEAIDLSKKMMDGHKAEAFVLGLSFIGWIFLSYFTCGILLYFYVIPYMMATYTEFYTAIKENYVPVPEYTM
ncbi:MAG: DUF975 family protein [Butyrivibrio sp.]|nr:DUF975 family protein [Butyrivibrio sp.]